MNCSEILGLKVKKQIRDWYRQNKIIVIKTNNKQKPKPNKNYNQTKQTQVNQNTNRNKPNNKPDTHAQNKLPQTTSNPCF